MFWRRGRKDPDDGANSVTSQAGRGEEDDLIKLQRQFGIKPVSDKDVEAEFVKLMGGGGRKGGLGLGLSPRSELALLGGGEGDSDEEEAKILRELNLSGKLDSINAGELSGEDVDDDDDSDDDDAPAAKIAKQEIRNVLAQVQTPAAKPAAMPIRRQSRPTASAPAHHLPAEIAPAKAKSAPLEFDDHDGGDVEVTDEDMNDPAYAAELAKLGFSAPPPKAKAPSQPTSATPRTAQGQEAAPNPAVANPPMLSIPLDIPVVAEVNDEDVEVTDEDMNDPAFAAELAKMGFSPTRAHASPIVAAQPPVQVASQLPTTTAVSHARHIRRRVSSVDEEDLIDEFDDDDDDDDDGHESKPSVTSTQPAQPVVSSSNSEPSFKTTPEASPSSPPQESTGMSIENLQTQLQRAKVSAVTLKREGNVQAALDMMKRIKQIENLIKLKQAQLSATAPPPAPPAATPQYSREAIERNSKFNELDALLVRFANDATRIAKEQLSVNRVKAAEWLAKRKEYSAHLATLREKRLVPGQPPPPVRIEQVVENVEVECQDVPLDEIHLWIVSVNDLQQAAGKDVFVKYNLGFPSTAPQEGKTGVFRISAAPSYSSGPISSENAFRAKVQRTRGTTRLFEIRKVVFEVWRSGSLLRNPELIARASHELAPLLCLTEVKTRVPFLGSNRKPVGGDVEISLRVRTPLREKQYQQVVMEVLRVGEYPPAQPIIVPAMPAPVIAPANPPPASNMPQVNTRPHAQSDASTRVTPAASANAVPSPPRTASTPSMHVQPSVIAKNPAAPKIPAPVPAQAAPDSGEDPHDLDLIISYDVINDEMERIEAMLPKLQGSTAEEYGDRLDALGLKKQLLEIDMQTGKLTLDMYVVRLKQRVLDDRKIIVRLMKSGRKPDAARVLHRVKIMEKELEGAEGGEEEGNTEE